MQCWLIRGGLGSTPLMLSMIFLLVNTRRKSPPIVLLSLLRSFCIALADLWSLNSKTILTGWSSGIWCCGLAWSCETMKLLMVDSTSRGRYFNFRNIDLKLLHSSAKRSGEDREITLFSRVSVYTYCLRDFYSAVRGLCWLFFRGHVLLVNFLSSQFPFHWRLAYCWLLFPSWN